jgi:hypothetical protein
LAPSSSSPARSSWLRSSCLLRMRGKKKARLADFARHRAHLLVLGVKELLDLCALLHVAPLCARQLRSQLTLFSFLAFLS